ncbi:hypothetical protein [Formosa sp. A9]|uniref:hypothetical protein n=1 Tax=Formosa sp. A9 TaxID=3442641 RepID=UPI003EB6C803
MTKHELARTIYIIAQMNHEASAIDQIELMLDPLTPKDKARFAKWGFAHQQPDNIEDCWPTDVSHVRELLNDFYNWHFNKKGMSSVLHKEIDEYLKDAEHTSYELTLSPTPKNQQPTTKPHDPN